MTRNSQLLEALSFLPQTPCLMAEAAGDKAENTQRFQPRACRQQQQQHPLGFLMSEKNNLLLFKSLLLMHSVPCSKWYLLTD